MEIGYIIAAIFAVIWITFEILDYRRKKAQQRIIEDNKKNED